MAAMAADQSSRQFVVTDAADPRLADYVAITDVRLRRSMEAMQRLPRPRRP